MSTPLRQPDALHDLLGEVLDELLRISAYVEPQMDASDDQPNLAMQIHMALEGCSQERGLIERVRMEWSRGGR